MSDGILLAITFGGASAEIKRLLNIATKLKTKSPTNIRQLALLFN